MRSGAGKSPSEILDGPLIDRLIDAAPIGFGIQDAHERVTYINRYHLDLLGCEDASEVVGKKIEDLLADDEIEAFQEQRERRQSGQAELYASTLKRKDGGLVRVLVSPVPILGADGEFIGSARFVLDLARIGAASPGPSARPVDQALLDELTAREREVFDCLIQGKSVREIAELSFISEHTVRNHIKAIYRKLGLHSRLDLLRTVLGT
jgi:PAS domain S-box-containing protein